MSNAASAKNEAPVIRIRGLRNQFGPQVMHDNLDLDIRRRKIIGIVGGSGTGKSVLLRSIIGLQTPATGSIEVLGHNALSLTEAEAKELRRAWGVLFQNGALFTSLTVAENVQVPLREYYQMDQTLLDGLAAFKIDLVGLPPEAGPKFPSDLSGGMRKRAGLARALALDPQILFLDEPTAGLDPIGAAAIDELILQLRNTLGLTVFLITHDLDTLHTICDRIAVLAEKRVIAVGTMEEMLEFQHPWVQDYFGGPRGRAAQTSASNKNRQQ
ncbi:MAG TPA: ABC transporter ATP-binding protein [Pedomonas sp.]|nr:ABC transporter ATP-binding protein [Pedomonas sp.]